MRITRATLVLVAGALCVAVTPAKAIDDRIVKKPAGAGILIAKPTATPPAAQRQIAAFKPAAQVGGKVSKRSPFGLAKTKALSEALSGERSVASSLHAGAASSRASSDAKPGAGFTTLVKLEPGIWSVNKKTAGFLVTPGGYLAISGYAFGDGIGQVNVLGAGFPAGALAMRVADWRNGQIYAFLPAVRGMLDQDVAVQVITRDAKTYRLNGGKFVATREEVSITSGIGRLVKFQGAAPAIIGGGFTGQARRTSSGTKIECFQPGQDTLSFVEPGRGFVVTGMSVQWGRSDSGDRDERGDEGNRMFYPGYALGDWYSDAGCGDCIKVNWGVWRSHSSPPVWGSDGYDTCESLYSVAVTMSGPAGVAF